MSPVTVRRWSFVHKWTSLVCTLFLLMLCLTGLPLIFADEIDAWTGADAAARMVGPPSAGTAAGQLPLDALLQRVRAANPGQVPLFMAFSNDSPITTITTAPTATARAPEMTIHLINRATGDIAGANREDGSGGLTNLLLRIHTDMMAGLKGELLLGSMGLLFVAALVSGAVIYAPYLRRAAFGQLRTSRSRRLKWLDYHNLLGIVALAWLGVVAITGVLNSFATPITSYWQSHELAALTRAHAEAPAVPPARQSSLDAAMANARRAIPGMNPQFIAFPGGAYSSQHHFAIFFQGATPLTERLLTVALVDAETGQLTAKAQMPWYFKALSMSQPLHFGDYGGLPLKILWALLDGVAIVVLGSGVYLWAARRRPPAHRQPQPQAAAFQPAE